jgi:hypothetical protein
LIRGSAQQRMASSALAPCEPQYGNCGAFSLKRADELYV